MHSRVFHRCLVTVNRVSHNADNSFLAHNGETRGSWRADRGEIWTGTESLQRESEPQAVAVGWWPGWLREGLKGDGLFAHCGHFWPERDKFNDYFNALLNKVETWNAMVRDASVFEICFQSPQGVEQRTFIHGSSARHGLPRLGVHAVNGR